MTAAGAPSTRPLPPQTRWPARAADHIRHHVETWLEAERDQLPLWIPVALGTGIAAWFVLPDARGWAAFLLAALAIGLLGLAAGKGGRAARVVAIGGVLLAAGLALAWWRAERVAAPVLARPVVAAFTARVAAIEPLPARGLSRLTLDPVGPGEVGVGGTGRGPIALPPRVRVNLAAADMPSGLGEGTLIRLRARLMPPPPPAVPGAYDFARVAWFAGIGATGRGFAPVERVNDPTSPRTCSGVHGAAQSAVCAFAALWTPEQVRGDVAPTATDHQTANLPGSGATATTDPNATARDLSPTTQPSPRTCSGVHRSADAQAADCADAWPPKQVRGDTAPAATDRQNTDLTGPAAPATTDPNATARTLSPTTQPSPRTCSGVHRPASAQAADCAVPWTPEQVRGDGSSISSRASYSQTATPNAPSVIIPIASWRTALPAHITGALPESAGGIAAALVTGDMGAIGEADAEAMRRAGLAHLLSVSGLHITAAVGATMLIVLRLLAFSPWMALNLRLPMIAAGAGAAAAIGYTLLTGSQVPTIRSCVAALLVLAAMALGRRAMTLRLVAAGALAVLILWPEALTGPSFQLSFAAITAIVALHEHPVVAGWFAPRDEGWSARAARGLASLLLTGLVVEAALMPIAVYHFHKAGLYGAVANIVAIPLTTFAIMPLVAGALAADLAGIGAPLWWLAGKAIALLLGIAHLVAKAPGAVAALPAMPGAAFALMVAGGLWLALWRTRLRRAGIVPLAIGGLWALATPSPDIVVTGDGRHLAVRTAAGLALLRDRAGDYTRATLAENGGLDGEPLFLADQPDARCSADLCLTDIVRDGRRWRLMATRSAYLVPAARLIPLCRSADIVVSDRRLPAACTPRWLKLDRATLPRTGGVAITLRSGRITTVNHPADRHPWRAPQSYRRRIPDSLP